MLALIGDTFLEMMKRSRSVDSDQVQHSDSVRITNQVTCKSRLEVQQVFFKKPSFPGSYGRLLRACERG